MTTTSTNQENTFVRRDIHQQVTDTIIKQLEEGTIPWQQPWTGDNSRLLAVPKNFHSGNRYRGINILLLWSSAISQGFVSDEWCSFKQWQEKKEVIRKGEKGSMIVYYDTIEKEVDGELLKIPFLKSSVVFNRNQLASYIPEKEKPRQEDHFYADRMDSVEVFVANTNAIVAHIGSDACYLPSDDIIYMPDLENFFNTATATASESYYSVLLHELTHWTGAEKRLNRVGGKKFGDERYANEELVAELGAAFLSSELEITAAPKQDHASYIAHWLKVLKDDKRCIFKAASEASKAVDYLKGLQP